MRAIEGFQHPIVELTGRWISKKVVRGLDERVPTIEQHWHVQLGSRERLRAVFLLQVGDQVSWGRSRGEPGTSIEASLHFFPMDWFNSDDVQINFAYQRHIVTSEPLKNDPREIAEIPLRSTRIKGGSLLTVAQIPVEPQVKALVLPVLASDTEETRLGKWRFAEHVRDGLPQRLQFLATGHQSGAGQLPLPQDPT